MLRTGGVEVQDFLLPRIGVRVTPDPHLTLRSNLGRYVRVPNLRELFGNAGEFIGNPALRPETAVNFDVGFTLALPALGPLSGLRLEYAWFDSQVDDLIVLVRHAVQYVRPENVSSASITGHEASFGTRVGPHLDVLLNYTHQRAVDDGDVTFLRGTRLPGRPADELTFRLERAWPGGRPLPLVPALRIWPGRLSYELELIAGNFLDRANERFVDSRLIHNVGLRLALPWRGLQLDFEVRNAGSDQTPDVLGFPVPGVSFYGTLSWGFGGAAGETAPGG
jgi:iron complex outermembrane receptor protein